MKKNITYSKAIRIISIILIIISLAYHVLSPILSLIRDLLIKIQAVGILTNFFISFLTNLLAIIPLIFLLIVCFKKDALRFNKQMKYAIAAITVTSLNFISIFVKNIISIFYYGNYVVLKALIVSILITFITTTIAIAFYILLMFYCRNKENKVIDILFIIFLVLLYLKNIYPFGQFIYSVLNNQIAYANPFGLNKMFYIVSYIITLLISFNIPIVETLFFIEYKKNK